MKPEGEKEKIEPVNTKLCIGPDGELRINRKAFEVCIQDDDKNSSKTRVEEGLGKRGQKRKEHSGKWSVKETIKFKDALRIFGTDFTIISKLMHPRSRKQIKVGLQ